MHFYFSATIFNVDEEIGINPMEQFNLYQKAFNFFKDPTMTKRWLNHPIGSFNNKCPLELSESEAGARQVEAYLDDVMKKKS